jgi:hypothetical protein
VVSAQPTVEAVRWGGRSGPIRGEKPVPYVFLDRGSKPPCPKSAACWSPAIQRWDRRAQPLSVWVPTIPEEGIVLEEGFGYAEGGHRPTNPVGEGPSIVRDALLKSVACV